ncbi:MAG: NHL repeat-containing protein [Gemmatimonadota bacterium]
MSKNGWRRYVVLLCGSIAAATPGLASGQETHADSDRPDLFVSSRNTNSVKRFDGATGEYLGDFVAPGSGGLSATQEVAFGPDGNLYVSGRGNPQILRFDGESGEFLGPFTSGYDLDEPTKMTFGPDGKLYVSQWGKNKRTVARFNAVTGVYVDEVTPALQEGMAHAWSEDGTLYVASYGSKDVRRFGPGAENLGVFTQGSELASAVNLWFGEDGDLFVLDWERGRVARFDGSDGSYEGVFIDGLEKAEGVTLGHDGALYICDWQKNQIHRYDAKTGEHLGIFASGGEMKQPNGLVFGPSHSD